MKYLLRNHHRCLTGLAIFSLAWAVAAVSDGQDDNGIRECLKNGIESEAEHRLIYDYVIGDSLNAKWKQIPWEADLWKGRIRSAETGKPLFIWAMNGDPLGCV